MHESLSKRGAGGNIAASLILLAGVAAIVGYFFKDVIKFWEMRPFLNSLIVTTFVGGAAYSIVSLFRVQQEFRILEIARQRFGLPREHTRELLLEQGRLPESQVSERVSLYGSQVERGCPPNGDSHAEKVALTFDMRNHNALYFAGLQILLGLLGTFIGLLMTISSIIEIIKGPSGAGSNAGIEVILGPLGGMTTAFSTSAFGLGTSIVLGFLTLQLRNANTRYISRLEALDSALFMPAFLEAAGATHFASETPQEETGARGARGSGQAVRVQAMTAAAGTGGGISEVVARYLEASQRQLKDNLDRLVAILERTEEMQSDYREAMRAVNQQVETTNVATSRLGASQDMIRESLGKMVELSRSQAETQRLNLAELHAINETLARLTGQQETTQSVLREYHGDVLRELRREFGSLRKLAGEA
jgi:hypothetical protein